MTKILVIEDDSDIRELIFDILTTKNFEVIKAKNGESGLKLALEERPTLIISDIHMPKMNGYEVLQQLREDPDSKAVPFIFLTAKTEKADFRKGMNLGADDYLTKPFTPEELIEAVQTRLKKIALLQEHYNQQIQEIQEKFNHFINYDPITNLPNRLSLRERFQELLEQWQSLVNIKNKETIVGDSSAYLLPVICLKLMRFNQIYDSLGEKIGDILLKKIASRLTTLVGSGGVVASVNTDEFAIILAPLSQKQVINNIAQSTLNVLSQPFIIEQKQIFITVNIGISCYPRDGRELGQLLNNGKKIIKETEKVGGNQYQFYSEILHNKNSGELGIEADLFYALEKNQFELYYQPRISLRTGKITGVEALLRWYHPQRQFISPAIFIPIAEETGLIEVIGEWVLKKACQQIKELHLAGFEHLRVAVNLSGRQFNKLDLYPKIVEILRTTGLSSKFLELEITESILVDNPPVAISKLNTLKSVGIEIAIDDFGTGYSSLGYLQKFPFNILKIDQCFVRNIHDNPANAAITKAIIEMAHQLKLNVIAEGIESKSELDFLSQYHCDEFQGYFFSPPVTFAKLENLLKTGKSLTTIS